MGKTHTAVVIGGGLSGLAAGYLLREAAVKAGISLGVTVLEGDARTGGKIGTLSEQGFRCEIGPNGFLDNKPFTLALVARMGMEDRLLRSNDSARKRYIFTGGKMRQLPESPVAFLQSDLMSWGGKIRIAREFFVQQKKLHAGEDETLGDFVRRRLGAEALEKLIDPMASGIFAGDPEEMSLKACFGKIVALEDRYGGLIRGMLALKRERKAAGAKQETSAGPGGALYSFREGLQEIIDGLAARLGPGSVLTGARVSALARRGSSWEVRFGEGAGRALACDLVVLAIPAYDAADLLAPYDHGIAATMRTIPYAGMAVVHLGYEERALPAPLDGFGFLIPGSEHRRILGGLWASSIFAGRAPEGRVLITVMMGGAKDPGIRARSEEEVVEIARAELRHTMGIAAESVFVRALRWDNAIPQYTFGHLNRVETIDRRLASDHPGILLTGNAFRGIGVNDCVAGGEKAAVAGVEHLKKIP
jgi:oxygen-dependent protoporphyrinogen oxidase